MSTSHHPGELALNRHFIRKAMELEIELEITEDELADLWKNRGDLGISRIRSSDEKDEPEEADLEVDGVPMGTNWGEPAWDSAKKAALRKMMASVLNDVEHLPHGSPRRVEKIVRQVSIHFDDGSSIAATITGSQPHTGGSNPSGSCECKSAHTKRGAASIDMVAAVHHNELLGALDARKQGAKDGRFWGYKVEGPFELYMLKEVPMPLARDLTDFPIKTSRLRNPKQAWSVAQEHAEGPPFKRVSR